MEKEKEKVKKWKSENFLFSFKVVILRSGHLGCFQYLGVISNIQMYILSVQCFYIWILFPNIGH